MNEVEGIRNQLALERAHAAAVANAFVSAMQLDPPALGARDAFGEFRRVCVEYLAYVLAGFEERDQRLTDLLQTRFGPADPAHRPLEKALAGPGRSREVLEKLEAACAASPSGSAGRKEGWREFAGFFNGAWSTRRDALDVVLSTSPRAADWRTYAGIDADSILEERRRYAQVASRLPPDVALGTGLP
jgi:hypothetical protein